MTTTTTPPTVPGRADRRLKSGPRTSNRTETLTVRIDPTTLRAAELVAQATCRSVSGLTDYALKLYIAKNYLAANAPGARLAVRIEEAPDEQTQREGEPGRDNARRG